MSTQVDFMLTKKINALILLTFLTTNVHAVGAFVDSTIDYIKMASTSKAMYLKVPADAGVCSGQLVKVDGTDPLFQEKVSIALAALLAEKKLQIWVDDQTCVAYDNDAGYIINK